MAIKYGLFDAAYNEQTGEYDRVYLSEDMAIFFNAITGSGIFKNIDNALEVVPSGAGMSVSVKSGFATALGRYLYNNAPYTVLIDGADSQTRIDLIIVRVSSLQSERNCTLTVKKGTPALSPEAPALTRNERVHELCLAKVTIPSGAISITDVMIEDTRADEQLCGYVSGLGGGSEIIDCIINENVDTYSSAWLLDKDGNEFQPEAKKIYRVLTTGKYKNCIYTYNLTENKYEGIGSYEVELTAEEALALWNSTPYARLSNIPAVDGNIQYTGQAVSPTWLYYDPTKLRIGGVTSATNVGVYAASFEPINGYAWPDGTLDVKYIEWSIIKKVVPIPIPMQTRFNYDGYEKEVVFNNLDTGSVTITNAKAINTGTYSVTATLNDPLNTIWSDETYTQKAWEYVIMGMQNIVTLSKSYVEFDDESDTDTITVSSSSGGRITIENSDEGIVHAELSGDIITLTPGDYIGKGTATITVNVEGSSTYEPGTATISVDKNYGVELVSFADGTDAEIVAMVQAADEGKIDLTDYWNVGDERVVRLNTIAASGTNSYGTWSVSESHVEQDITLVLMDGAHYDLTTPVLDKDGNQRTKCNFVVGLKNALVESGNISSSEKTMWKNTSRYKWCNAAFAGAIPQTLIGMFKSFKVGSAADNYGNTIGYTDDLFSLFANREILNDSSSVPPTAEWSTLTQIEHYKTDSNKIKKAGDAGSEVAYFTRSVRATSDAYYAISKFGTSVTGSSSDRYYLAPFGCI